MKHKTPHRQNYDSQQILHSENNGEKHLIATMCIVAIFMWVEFIGGLISNSLALMADSVHMLSDFVSLLLSWLSQKYSRKPPDLKRSYGYSRMQILAAFLNGLGLILVSIFVLYSSIRRLVYMDFVISSDYMLIITLIGTCANILIITILKSVPIVGLNIRSAILHAKGDFACSIVAVICALIIQYTGFILVDPILSILVSILMLRSAAPIISEAGHILLEGTPENIRQDKIKRSLIGQCNIIDVHHVHVWMLVENYILATMHIIIEDGADIPSVIRHAKKILSEKCNIQHSTIEVEEEAWGCADNEREN